MDFVFTLCDTLVDGASPQWPGTPMIAHWAVPDPVACEGSEAEKAVAMADVYRMLSNRIGIFVNLPISALDRLTLQRRLHEIGRGR
jgi:hypothetical protein